MRTDGASPKRCARDFPWDSEDEWRAAGARLHTIQGLVRAEVTRASVSSAAPGAEGIWHDSYEAEQHLLHLGQADEPVCWTLTGFASGYMSCVYGKEIIAIEDRCRGKGDAVCRAVVRSKEEWGPELATHLPFYEKEACLDAALAQLTDTLKKKERQLQSRRALRQSRSPRYLPVLSARVRRCFGRSIWRGASRRSTRRSSSRVKAGRERSASRVSFTTNRRGRPDRSSRSIARPSPKRCWSPNSSDTPAAHSRARRRIARVSSRLPTAARCSSMKSATCRRPCR